MRCVLFHDWVGIGDSFIPFSSLAVWGVVVLVVVVFAVVTTSNYKRCRSCNEALPPVIVVCKPLLGNKHEQGATKFYPPRYSMCMAEKDTDIKRVCLSVVNVGKYTVLIHINHHNLS